MTHRERKQAIRSFMQAHYTDERLAMLLAHARDGKLGYFSCCCFIGIPTANHALQRELEHTGKDLLHLRLARNTLRGADEAEIAFLYLAKPPLISREASKERIRILIPMIRAEMRRRERLRESEETIAILQEEAAL